eukprot:XP_019920875.1 PREDICTED: uncharacterized protein LOC109618083 [Crassostrea gigas]
MFLTSLTTLDSAILFEASLDICTHRCALNGIKCTSLTREQVSRNLRIEGQHHQINYLIDEDQGIGENGAGIKGANGVVSMLHHCLTTYGSGEKSCVIHCDNCAGENKNRYVLGYLMWRTLMGLHHDIQLSMQVPYHGRCLVDAGFANIKRLYHRTDVDSLSGLVEVVRKSARSNSHVTYINNAGEHSWEWYDWKSFTSTFFTNVKGIRKSKSHADDSERETTLMKSSISPEDITTGSVIPDILPPGGMTSERQRYLFCDVRPFVRDPFKDTTSPEAEE